jgi:uncharacterized protein (DUF427 family)
MSNKMDAWYEEDEQVFVHPSVKVNGEVVAETDRSMILFETGLPPRWVDAEVEGERQERPHTQWS